MSLPINNLNLSVPSRQASDAPAQCGSRRQTGVSLDLLFPAARRTGGSVVFAKSCTSDWRQVQPGDVFVALDDGEQDGHESAREAVARGAVAVVCERGVPVFNAPVYQVEDSRAAYGQLCHALAGNPSHQLAVIAVTGTQGKSTTLALLQSIFKTAGKEAGLLSSFQTYDGMSRGSGMNDTPTPASLASRLANMDAAGCTHALLEVSSQTLAEGRLAGIELDTVCVTQISTAHLEQHHTPQRYREAKRRILEYLSADGVTILNAGDQESCRWLSEVSGPTFVYGTADAPLTADVITQNANEQVFLLSVGRESVAVRTTILGEHHVQNCLAAATTALTHGISLQDIARGLEAVQTLSGRMQRVDCGQDFPVFVDAAHTSDALHATLRTARQLASGRVICVLGDQASGNANENTMIQNVVCKLADVAIVTEELALASENWPQRRTEGSDVQIAVDRREAIEWAVASANAGDIVVLAGSKLGPSISFGQNATDLDVARDMLYARSETPLRLVA